MSKKSKKKLKKKERQALLKSAANSRKAAKSGKKAALKLTADRNGHAAAKAKKGRLVYFFGDGRSDGDGRMKALLGGKGANLAEMTRIGLPVPPGFTITTEVCTSFNLHGKTLPKEIDAQIDDARRCITLRCLKPAVEIVRPAAIGVRRGVSAVRGGRT